GEREGSGEEVGFVFVVRRHGHVEVIVRAPSEVAVVADKPPVLAAVIGAPQLAAICLLTFQRNAIAGLDQRVHAVRVGSRNGDSDLTGRASRQSATSE